MVIINHEAFPLKDHPIFLVLEVEAKTMQVYCLQGREKITDLPTLFFIFFQDFGIKRESLMKKKPQLIAD